jgi:hypothetical protein
MANKEPKDNIGTGPGRGRPKGARNRCGAEFRAIIAEAGPDVAKRIVEIARDKDHSDQLVACRFIGDRLDPPPRGTRVRFDLPRVQSIEDLPVAIDAILQACASGKLTTAEASDLANALTRLQTAITLLELERRMKQIEVGTGRPASPP